MEMQEKEIVQSYMMAKERGKQIKILAELNCCPKEKIMEILRNNGVEVNGRVFNCGNHKKPKDNKELPVGEAHEALKECQEFILPKALHVPQLAKSLIESEIERLEEDIKNKQEAAIELMAFLNQVEEYEKENKR